MATYTREAQASVLGRWAANKRHHPEADHSADEREALEVTLGYRLQTVRDTYPGVTLTEEQVERLVAVLR